MPQYPPPHLLSLGNTLAKCLAISAERPSRGVPAGRAQKYNILLLKVSSFIHFPENIRMLKLIRFATQQLISTNPPKGYWPCQLIGEPWQTCRKKIVIFAKNQHFSKFLTSMSVRFEYQNGQIRKTQNLQQFPLGKVRKFQNLMRIFTLVPLLVGTRFSNFIDGFHEL